MYIFDGHAIGATSVYTMEYLPPSIYLRSARNCTRLDVTPCRYKQTIRGRRLKLSHLHKQHHCLFMCIDGSLHRGSPILFYIRAHADMRKPKKDSRGHFGLKLIEDDWNSYIASRVVTESEDDILFYGLHVIKTDITAAALYNSLGHP